MLARASLTVLVAFFAVPGLAWAQRNGDVRGGFDNQPTTGEVLSREKAAGVLPPASVRQRRTGEVDSIYEELLGQPPGKGTATDRPPRGEDGGRR